MVSKIRILFILVCLKVEGVLGIQGEFDEAPVVVKSFLFDVLVFLSDNLMSNI